MPDLVLLPQGFKTAGLSCGIKNETAKFDLSLFVSDVPASAAGVFTQNRVCGAPVQVSRKRLPSVSARAVIINSGNANACTGQRGLDDARWMTDQTAEYLGCNAKDVLVCSTGVIGHFLPREKLATGIPAVVDKLSDTSAAFADAARGIMTTDTYHKQSMREITVNGKTVRVSGVSKGAAMIAPNMATMLSVIMTDANLDDFAADVLLRRAVNRSFNCISVEGHTSTSDTVLLLANGAAGAGPLPLMANGFVDVAPEHKQHFEQMQQAMDEVATDLAMAIINDAEGADHLITIDVTGARNHNEARAIAKTVADSPLVKTAIAGADPNWGRIVSAVGYAGVDLQETDISLIINGTPIYRAGAPLDYDERAVSQSMKENRDVSITLELTHGEAAVRFWTCDLTTEYVRLNSEYTT